MCIHYDECQHVFPRRPNETSRTLLDSFKALMKDPRWPLMLIMSGVDKLAGHVAQEEQLVHLLRPVHFDGIRLPRDRDELSSLCFSYCEKAGLDFGDLATESFLRRLDHACVHR